MWIKYMVIYSRPGYELSDIERTLLFEKEDAGYVVWKSRRKKVAQLSPSPFLKPKEPYYLFETKELPEENELVEVKVISSQRIPLPKPVNGQCYLVKKVVGGWKRISPASIIKKYTLEEYLTALGLRPTAKDVELFKRAGLQDEVFRSLIDPEIIRSAVAHPFRKIDEIAIDTILMFLASSPPDSLKGGISAAALGKKSVWNTLGKLFRAIPPEFKRVDGRIFYRYAENPGTFSPDNVPAREVSLNHRNPENIHVHVPQPLHDAKIRDVKLNELEISLLRAFIIQALLITPHISKSAENAVLDAAYRVHEVTILSEEGLPFRLDMSFVKRVPLSMGRLTMKDEIMKEDIQETIDNWIQAYQLSLEANLAPISPKIYFEMGEGERLVYKTILELGGLDRPVPYREIYDEVRRSGREYSYDLENILRILSMKGVVIEPRVNTFRAIELSKSSFTRGGR